MNEEKVPFGGANDPLYEQAVAFLRKNRYASNGTLQRALKVGEIRARYMLDAMVGTVLKEHPPTRKFIK